MNDMRQVNQYNDEYAENEINRGSVDKPKLTKSPFVATFKYVASVEGYWTYDRLILHLYYCID